MHSSGQRRSWSNCADAQADLGLRCPHMPEEHFRLARPILIKEPKLTKLHRNNSWIALTETQRYGSQIELFLPGQFKTSVETMYWFPLTRPQKTVVVMWRLHYVNILKRTLQTNTYMQTSKDEKSKDEKSVTDNHHFQSVTFAISITDHHDELPNLYWLSKLHKSLPEYKAGFSANSSYSLRINFQIISLLLLKYN